MLSLLAPLALVLTQAPAAQALPELNLEQGSALRCSVAFGLVHRGQLGGDPAMAAYPVMAERGQEFFVRTAAQLMDDLDIDRTTIMGLVERESAEFAAAPQRLGEVMPACLMMLDAAGL
ncbi:hypothetical protein [Qipengyuania flava]|uniref:hypothetical protein n=1 Tax=Qipengyuania flava TaxID=192812 RepID=UPI001C631421|nr:hypothetical protein [Qipengyuania flava]QYJ07619.1 hypothetical protein KUV82_02540 [Qipengyuania flava]